MALSSFSISRGKWYFASSYKSNLGTILLRYAGSSAATSLKNFTRLLNCFFFVQSESRTADCLSIDKWLVTGFVGWWALNRIAFNRNYPPSSCTAMQLLHCSSAAKRT